MFEPWGLVGLAPALGGPGALGWAQDVGRAPAVAVWCAVGLHGCFVLFCVVLCDGVFFYFLDWLCPFAVLRGWCVRVSLAALPGLLTAWDRPSFFYGRSLNAC